MATPCSERAAHVVLDFHTARRDVRVRTDAQGRYAVRLAPGRYLVRFSPAPASGRGIAPAVVVVRRALRADFNIDTGIR
jgi:hypothetical protein